MNLCDVAFAGTVGPVAVDVPFRVQSSHHPTHGRCHKTLSDLSAGRMGGVMAVTVDVPFTPRLPRFVRDRLPQIRAACERFHVDRLWLYGSAVSPNYQPRLSDLDFMVVFTPEAGMAYDGPSEHCPFGPPTRPGSAYPVNYRALRAALRDIFDGCLTETEGREQIDIGSYKFIDNKYFQASVDATKVELYARP